MLIFVNINIEYFGILWILLFDRITQHWRVSNFTHIENFEIIFIW
jgi:hypothetical protein